jgi:hypothetical protein
MTYATSRSPAFALASAPLHAACITMLWMRSTSCDGRRWMGVAGGMLWYLQLSQKLPPSAPWGASANAPHKQVLRAHAACVAPPRRGHCAHGGGRGGGLRAWATTRGSRSPLWLTPWLLYGGLMPHPQTAGGALADARPGVGARVGGCRLHPAFLKATLFGPSGAYPMLRFGSHPSETSSRKSVGVSYVVRLWV